MALDTSNSGMSPTSKVFARHVAPFAPLALALLMNAAPPSAPAPGNTPEAATGIVSVKCDEVADSQDCHSRFPTGCSAGGQYDAYLNFWKNQLIAPDTASNPVKYFAQLSDYQKLDTNIPPGLTQNNQGGFQDQLKQLGEGQLYGVIGYLYYFQHTGAESSNCDLIGPPGDPDYGNVDYHIGIGFDPTVAQQLRPDAAAEVSPAGTKHPAKRSKNSGSGASMVQQTSIIVEMTPHDRFQYENRIWTLENLKRATGRQVKVVGQLIVDNEHNLTSQNCATAQTAANRQTCWRASAWELHPVVRFQVCPTDSCLPDATDWVELDQLP
ncbi:MAG: hypothetical protein ACLP6G_18980 [Terriglobales bacterium]